MQATPTVLVPDGLVDGLADVDDGAENLVGNSVLWTDGEGNDFTTGTVLDGMSLATNLIVQENTTL